MVPIRTIDESFSPVQFVDALASGSALAVKSV
jgi:hypothetical protein